MNEIRTENGSAGGKIIRNTRKSIGKKLGLLLLFTLSFVITAVAQWTEGQIVYDPPAFGNYYSMKLGSDGPPLPWLPLYPTNMTVYALGTIDGATAFAYDDRPTMQRSEDDPPAPGEGGEGEDPGVPLGRPADIGTDLYIDIGPLTNNLAWLALTNTINGTYYQLESRNDTKPGTPWQYGQIVKDTSSVHQVSFDNAPTDKFRETYYRGVGGSTVVSIYLDPDYNLAVEPATNGGAGQVGKFLITLSDAPSSSLSIVYKISGTASNGVDYSTIGVVTNISSGTSVEIPINPLFASLPATDKSVTLSLVLTNGYLVNPDASSATMKIYGPRPAGMAVAILDSGWTKFRGLSSPAWNYFVLPETVKEAMRSDGTPYVVLSDLDIATGALLNTNGTPKYPILISLANEVIKEEEIGPLTNYVAAGGFVFAGSSAFTKFTDGSFRTNFALASQMGISCPYPSAANWYGDTYTLKLTNHVLVNDLPDGSLAWRMPASADEVSWGSCLNGHDFTAPHPIWSVSASSALTLVRGDYCDPIPSCPRPYLTVNKYGSGYFIYDAALQPLLGHGGFAPGMYAYVIFRRAIEWAFQSAQYPVVKVSPWPYPYNAAFMVRHDLENYADAVAGAGASAQFEHQNGVKGDYYFCTGCIINDPYTTFSSAHSSIVTALGYGAAFGPHNGGLPNPTAVACGLGDSTIYEYWHWGPDEALDTAFGYEYASNSLALSFNQIESWCTNQSATPRVWVAPYFNATREGCYSIEEALDVKITGDQKLTPFPAFTLSSQTDGKRYQFLSEPVSDWFTSSRTYDYLGVAQSLDPWHPPGVHTPQTIHDGVDFYYTNGFLINFYAHGLSTGDGGPKAYPVTAGYLIPEYIQYGANTNYHPRLWGVNARDVYQWWLNRSSVRVGPSFSTAGTNYAVTATINGVQDTNTAIEILATGGQAPFVSQLLTNGSTTGSNDSRIFGNVIKVRVGPGVTNIVAQYFSAPLARDDRYAIVENTARTVTATNGVLGNDWLGTWSTLVAINTGLPQHGTLSWDVNNDGGFTYTPNTGFWGTDCFTYEATDGIHSFGTATVTLTVNPLSNTLFSDDFRRCAIVPLSPWNAYWGTWNLGTGFLQGTRPTTYGYSYIAPVWTNYSVEAQVQLAIGSYGGGIGARANTGSGAHYAAWLYPDFNVISLIKFSAWDAWGYNGTNNSTPIRTTNVNVGSGWHSLKLVCSNNVLQVYYHGTNVINTVDADSYASPLTNGAVTLDVYAGSISVSNLVVNPAQ